MKPDQLNKLILQVLPAVAARPGTPPPLDSAEALKAYWGSALSEAESVAKLFHSRFIETEEEKKKYLEGKLIAETI